MDEKDGINEECQVRRILSVPVVERAHYSKKFIRQAVCELRFPTIFEIDGPKPPPSFWKVVRREFPNHDVLTNVNLGPASLAQANAHQFRSKQGRWTVVIKPSAITLETSRYNSFEEFASQLSIVIDAAKGTIDSEFFTRVGLRYINVLPCGLDEVAEWVNQALIRPLAQGVYGDADEYRQQIRGTTDCGGYYFQHGIIFDDSASSRMRYFLDYDFYREEVDVVDAMETVRRLHDLEFSLFTWSLGEKARDFLKAPQGDLK